MKRIINGFRYDTDKAIEIGSHDHGYYPGSGDFSHWSASLYVTPRARRFFLAGEGGAITRFATHHPDGTRGGGERIIPLSPSEALGWAETHLDPEAVEKHFADMVKDA